MSSLDRDFLERQAVPLEFAGTLRQLGEYRGKQELYKKQMPQDNKRDNNLRAGRRV